MSQPQIKKFNFTELQLAKLCKMQDELNTYIHPDWKWQGFDWETAVNDECLEILGHLGWKWWKDNYKQGITEANKPQIKLELIDLLHFVVSSRLENSPEPEYGFLDIVINTAFEPAHYGFYESVKILQQDALHYGITGDTVIFLSRLMHLLDMDAQEILETYTQKYVLNKFRQDHGYKDGSYVKEWEFGRPFGNDPSAITYGFRKYIYEDNQVLELAIGNMKLLGEDATNEEELYKALELLYNSRLNK